MLSALLVLTPALCGWQRYAIVSGSMTGTYDRGSLVLDEVVPVDRVEASATSSRTSRPRGRRPPDHPPDRAIGRDTPAQRVFRTKGDANAVADPWTFRLGQPTQARVRVGVPYAGYALGSLGRRDVRMIVIALPALLIAGFSLTRLWRQLGVEAKRRSLEGAA